MIKTGQFREDLFYRLNVVPFHLPPLRQRGDDVLELSTFFLGKMAVDTFFPPKPAPETDQEKQERMAKKKENYNQRFGSTPMPPVSDTEDPPREMRKGYVIP